MGETATGGVPRSAELWADLRKPTRQIRRDWDITDPQLRVAWERSERTRFFPYGKSLHDVFDEWAEWSFAPRDRTASGLTTSTAGREVLSRHPTGEPRAKLALALQFNGLLDGIAELRHHPLIPADLL